MRENAERFRKARPGRPAVFAVNKADLVPGQAHVDGAEELAAEYHGVVVYTSAATGDEVPHLFRSLARSILQVDG
jgi:50S ribosomal subunit-associated GTPase HflX